LGRQQVLMSNAACSGMLHGLSVNQPFELPMLRSARIRAATVRRQTAEAAHAETRMIVRGSVKQAFFEALRRKREVEIVTGNAQLLEDLRHRIELQVKVVEAARLELARAEAEVAILGIPGRTHRSIHREPLRSRRPSIGGDVGSCLTLGRVGTPADPSPHDPFTGKPAEGFFKGSEGSVSGAAVAALQPSSGCD
jgi:hypothetical protein